MANYAIDPAVLTPYLPSGVELDFHEGKTYVSLVGFMFRKTSLFKIPIPLMGTFEEVNLRFYVKRIIGNEVRRGVVFISETVPFQIVAKLANSLYKEHYITIPTRHKWEISDTKKHIEYSWKMKGTWNSLTVNALTTNRTMTPGSLEEFIFEHYYGYTKVSNTETQEYKVEHPKWNTNEVLDYEVNCDFGKMYGNDFAFLSKARPDSVVISEGSPVAVKWKRTNI